jgi:hypothetical protein
MRNKYHWIPVGGLLVTIAIVAVIVADLYAQKAPAGDYSKAVVAEVRDGQGQVILRGQFVLVDDSDDEDTERKAKLEPTGIDADAAGEAEVEVSKGTPAEQEIEFSIRNVQASAVYIFVIDGREIAKVTADRRGRAEVDLEVATSTAAPAR